MLRRFREAISSTNQFHHAGTERFQVTFSARNVSLLSYLAILGFNLRGNQGMTFCRGRWSCWF